MDGMKCSYIVFEAKTVSPINEPPQKRAPSTPLRVGWEKRDRGDPKEGKKYGKKINKKRL
jgi:hypothetical protein